MNSKEMKKRLWGEDNERNREREKKKRETVSNVGTYVSLFLRFLETDPN